MERKLKVTGMTCAACSARVEKAAMSVDGVQNVQVNLLTGTVTFSTEGEGAVEKVIDAITKSGYGVDTNAEVKQMKQKTTSEHPAVMLALSFVFLIILMYFTMGKMLGLPMPFWYIGTQNVLVAGLLQFFLMLPIVFLNRGYYLRGFKAVFHGGANMDTLIAVGSGAAILHGVATLFHMAYAAGNGGMDLAAVAGKHLYFESAATILTLVSLGKYLEGKAKGRTGDAIEKLMQLRPKTASCLRDGKELIIPVLGNSHML